MPLTETETAPSEPPAEPAAAEPAEAQAESEPTAMSIELELDDGLVLTLPEDQARKVREGFLRHADYSKKTMALADERKAFAAEQARLEQASKDQLDAAGDVRALERQILGYRTADWNAWNERDPQGAQKAFIHYQQLKDAHAIALGRLNELTRARQLEEQQETARRIEEGRAALTRDIGWSESLKASLETFAGEFGFTREEIADIEADPRAARVLHEAWSGREARRKQEAAERHAAAQQVTPAATVGSPKPPPSGLDDRLSVEEWMKRRSQQVRRRRG